MVIDLNNNTEQFNCENATIDELLKMKNYSFRLLVIKVNDVLIKKEEYSHFMVKDGDKVDIIHLMSGG